MPEFRFDVQIDGIPTVVRPGDARVGTALTSAPVPVGDKITTVGKFLGASLDFNADVVGVGDDRQARQFAGIGASDLPNQAAVEAYKGPPREIVVGATRLHVQDGVTAGGIPQARLDDVTTAVRTLSRSVSTSDARFAGGSVADCTAQGVGTDLAPILKAAWDWAIANIGDGAVIEVPQGRYRWATPITLNGSGKKNITLNIIGNVTSDATAMRCLKVVNTQLFRLSLTAQDGGRFAGHQATLPYYVDYGNVADVVAGGGQEMVVIDGVFDYEVSLIGINYAGRLLRITDSHTAGYPQTGAIKGRIRTTRDPDFSKPRTAQSMYADPGNVVGQGNWGNLDLMNNDFDAWPFKIVNWNDIKIGTIDAAYSYGGPEFLGCVAVILPDVYIGELDFRNPASWHLILGKSANRGCDGFQIGHSRFLNSGGGVLVDGGGPNISLGEIVHSAGSTYPRGEACRINNTPGVRGFIRAPGPGAAVLHLLGSLTDNVEIKVDVPDIQNTYPTLFEPGIGEVTLSGKIAGVTNGAFACLGIGSTNVIRLVDMKLRKGSGNHLDCPANNKVIWCSGSYDGPTIANKATAPKYVDPNMVAVI